MNKIRFLGYIILLATLLASACQFQAPAAHPDGPASDATPELPSDVDEVDPAVQAALKLCENILPGQVCLGEGPAQVTAQPGRTLMPFRQPGQVLNLADIQTLKLGEAGSTQGLAFLRIQTEWPGEVLSAVAFGDVELVNEVPFGTREFNPMQSLQLTTGATIEGQAPTSGLFVESPEGGNLPTLVVNGAELSFGSTGLLTSLQGGLTVQTVWGDVGLWLIDKFVEVVMGQRLDLTDQEIQQKVVNNAPYDDPRYKDIMKLIDELIMDEGNTGGTAEAAHKKYLALQELRRKQKAWKGGWWKMTYGPGTTSGQCKGEAVGDGGGDGSAYTEEIPICRGNNGNTILMYDSGVSYDRIGPNLFAQSTVSEYDFLGNGNYTTEGQFMTLQIVSPTRMVLSHARTEAGGCTTAGVMYLDFVRDDPAVRCGKIIYVDPFITPEAPTPTPEPQDVDPPLEGPYQVRLGILSKACDPQARNLAPNFSNADVSLSPENKLVIDAASTKYELELSNLTYPFYSQKMAGEQDRYGIFSLQQPLDDTFILMLTLVQMPGRQWSGNWLVMNEDASQMCSGSIDLLPPG